MDNVTEREREKLIESCTDYSVDEGCGCDTPSECWVIARVSLLEIRRHMSYCNNAPDKWWLLIGAIEAELDRKGGV